MSHRSQNLMHRREWLARTGFGLAGVSASGWMQQLAANAATDPRRKRSCILLWMAGGPAQTDTFDLKPGHSNGGPFREIETAATGVRFSEHLPQLAKQSKHLALLRSLKTREGDHGRATAHLRTGYVQQGSIRYPTLGSLVAHELADASADLPGFVSVVPQGAFSQPSVAAGFLGPQYAPLIVGGGSGAAGTLKVEDLEPAGAASRSGARVALLRDMETEFLASRSGSATASHVTAYDRASRIQRPAAAQAFDLSTEKPALRDRYGRSQFGQGCLLARRLVERGVPFVEVTLNGWDTHDNNFEQVKTLSNVLDPAWATLMEDLGERGLLDQTLVVWMGEFGRTPGINPRNGRDHFPVAWSVVLGGGGIKAGQVVGKTSPDGLSVADRPIAVPDLMATICRAIGLDPMKQNQSNVDRPIRLADPVAKPVTEVLE